MTTTESAATRRGMRLSQRLPMAFTTIGLLAGILSGAVVLWLAVGAILVEDQKKTEAVVSARATELANYLEAIDQDLHFQSENPFVLDALVAFDGA